MSLLLEIVENGPTIPDGGWNVGHLANLGILLSCDGFSVRFDLNNLNLLFDLVEDGESGDVRDHEYRIIEVTPLDDSVVLKVRDDPNFPLGVVLDLSTLKEMGIEQHEETTADPDSEYDSLEDQDTIDDEASLELTEGVKRAFRRSGKKIKRGFRVTSGFRKGRIVATAAGAFKPRAKASTRMKLKIAARRKKVVRVLKGQRTRRKPSSQRLVRMNKRIP